MSIKILNHIKKVIVALAIISLCSPYVAQAFSIGVNSTKSTSIRDLINRFFNLNVKQEEYKLEDLQIDLTKMKKSGNYNLNDISGLINKLPAGEDKDILSSTVDFTKLFEGENIDLKGLLDTLLKAIESLLGGIGDLLGGLLGGIGGSSSSLPVEPESIYMDAKTAVEFGGNDVAAKLHANVYRHVNENGKVDSNKWALLVHPFMLKGETIANNVGPFYYEKGYNIIAPDLRGFGESEGSVALGCLESMDIYDWLVKLNEEYSVNQVIVHGISLGGATTNYLSGIDGFLNNGPTKLDTQIKSIRELKVVGLVEDCGYVDMTEFATKSIVQSFSGLKDDTFDYYSKATNSLKYCDLPILIIHGTSDTTVKPENAETIKNTVKGDVDVWMVNGGVHAFIIMGSNKDEYKDKVQKFIDEHGKASSNIETPEVPETPTNPEVPVKPETPEIPEEPKEEKTDFFKMLTSLFGFLK